MAFLFISYARADGTEFAQRLEGELRPHEAWLDTSRIEGGMTWGRELEQAIDRCDAMLAVLTRRYGDSRWTRRELSRADRTGKRVIPLRLHADAGLPLFLEETEPVDFSRSPAEGLRELLALLGQPGARPAAVAGEGEGAAAAAAPDPWEALQARAAKQARRFLDAQRGADAAGVPGIFDEALYVRRSGPEGELARFLEGPAAGLLLIGDSGVGKTNLLCRWTLDLLEQGHAVLAYDAGAQADPEVEREVVRDLGAAGLDAVDAEAARAGRKLVLVFDSLGDFRGEGEDGAEVLLRRINAMVQRAGDHVRIVASCNAATWARMERAAPMRLDRHRYFTSAGERPFLGIDGLTAEELEEAYPKYREVFGLFSAFADLPPSVRERLRNPLLLRMAAEVYRGRAQPLPADLADVHHRFLQERVARPREVLLVESIAERMIREKAGALSVSDLGRDEAIGRDVLDDDPRSAYSRLLDSGVIQEWQDGPQSGLVVKFHNALVAAYALARRLLAEGVDVAQRAAELVAQDAQSPLAWDTARTLLATSGDRGALVALASSRDGEERELATEALLELHGDDPSRTVELLRSLLEGESEEGRRTALKAAYAIGPGARELFLHAAIDGDAALRESVKNTLYLIWRRESPGARAAVTDAAYVIWRYAPGFTHELQRGLLDQIQLRQVLKPRKFRTLMEFFLDLTITIYINHCEEEEVIERTAALLEDLAVDHLHLNLFNTGVLGATFEQLVFRGVARVFAKPILSWMLFAETTPVEEFFALPREERACLSRVADTFDPASELAAAHDDLRAMLESGRPIFAGSAAMAIGVHAAHDPARTEPLVRRLWEETGPGGRLWLLAAFSVLLKDTPPAWVPLLEDLTRRYVTEHRDAFLAPSSRLAGDLDVVLVPLGLAYGKNGGGMPLLGSLLRDALAAGDTPLASRLVAALGAVGFYYPHATFEVVLPAMAVRGDAALEEALVSALATVRTLHFDAVDQFLQRTGASAALAHGIGAASDVGLVHRYIRVLGYYNNAVHFTLRYPRMRRSLSAGALRLLADAEGPGQFIADYTRTAMVMLREARYQVKQWTLPEQPAPP